MRTFIIPVIAGLACSSNVFALNQSDIAALTGEWITDDGRQTVWIMNNGQIWLHKEHGSAHIRLGVNSADVQIFYDSTLNQCAYHVRHSDQTLWLTPVVRTQDVDFCPEGKLNRVTSPPPPSQPSSQVSRTELWTLNQSLMRVRIGQEGSIEVVYLRPREELRAYGIREGTLNFAGTLTGDTVNGQSYVYSGLCNRSYSFPASGVFKPGTMTLTGQAPMIGQACEPQSYRDDVSTYERVPGQ